jgi:hypothetical protein
MCVSYAVGSCSFCLTFAETTNGLYITSRLRFCMVLTASKDYFLLNSISQFTFVMVKCGVCFEVWTGFLNII